MTTRELDKQNEITARMTPQETPDVKHLKMWLDHLIKQFQKSDADTRGSSILEDCGKVCAEYQGMIFIAQKIRSEVPDPKDLNALIKKVNERFIVSSLRKEDNNLLLRVNECPCPLRNKGWINNPKLCDCTLGWNKAFFYALLDKPVDVKLVKTIAGGDDYCLISVAI